ncbi:hypothetical protein AAJ76_350000310 [Vairimorpha ceranae]|uniref:Uncharacterized protein n=1 Tax=Vairimorpha ceranae TaxID=40302 RepID=A0A0F9WKH3_9MICR|nr:hypothetical protein AAJ76_350000310 [Vairimorpha ceranae]KKO73643.1 hypothetical protein AAJ76_350000310 [Vairimorpha ceranae]
MSTKCVYRVLKKVLERLIIKFYSNIYYIESKNKIIEIGKSKIGKRKYNKGHPSDRRCMDLQTC